MKPAAASLAGATPRRPSRWRRLADRLRSRGWGAARDHAALVTLHCQGRLCQDVVTGLYGTLELAFANRGSLFGGARVHVRLVTRSGRTLYVPWREVRLADDVERRLWTLAGAIKA